MTPFTYSATTIRDDIPAAHQRVWERLAAPGTWWTGAERVAIAHDVRLAQECDLCRRRKDALSPAGVEGDHTTTGALPPPAVEAVHRLTTDSGRLSRAWYEDLLGPDFSDAHYVELVGVVTQTFSVDELHRALGLPLEPLPEPRAGDPARRRPSGARDQGAWVPMVDPSRLDPEDADLYGGARRTGNVIKALSLVPAEVRALIDLHTAHYLGPEDMPRFDRGRTLDRSQLELVAARVSALNECFY